jgi:hypothetical protein
VPGRKRSRWSALAHVVRISTASRGRRWRVGAEIQCAGRVTLT